MIPHLEIPLSKGNRMKPIPKMMVSYGQMRSREVKLHEGYYNRSTASVSIDSISEFLEDSFATKKTAEICVENDFLDIVVLNHMSLLMTYHLVKPEIMPEMPDKIRKLYNTYVRMHAQSELLEKFLGEK